MSSVYTKSECEKWINSSGKINPKTNAKIDPNNTNPKTKNVEISNQCYEKYGILRNKNPYKPNKNTKEYQPDKQEKSSEQKNIIHKYIRYDLKQLRNWWEEGVMKKNDEIHFKNPISRKSIIENGPIYNALLQQTDFFCLIPVSLDHVKKEGYLSLDSIQLLKMLRTQVNDENWTPSTVLQKFPYLDYHREDYFDKMFRQSKYNQYILRYNIKYRISKNFTEESMNKKESVENIPVSYGSIDYSQIPKKCSEKYQNINDKYKKFKNKMIKTCHNFENHTMLSNKEINYMLNTYQNKLTNSYTIINISNYSSILSLFYTCLQDKYFAARMFDRKIIVLNYEEDENYIFKESVVQDYGGVRDQMMTNVAKELFDMKIFERPDNSTKYFFNPEFSFTKEHISYLKTINDYFTKDAKEKSYINTLLSQNNLYNEFYKFLGNVISFFIIKRYKLPDHLSSYILYNLKYKSEKINDFDHTLFITKDFPEISTVYLELMKLNKINDLNYNNQYKIQYDKDDGDDITEENIDKYFIDLAKHLNIHNTTPVYQEKNLNVDMEVYHKCFSEGINKNLRKLFQYKDASLELIDKILTQEKISNEILMQLSNNIYDNFSIDDASYSKYFQIYHQYLNNIFFKTRFKNEKDKMLFIKNLLQFWTGIDFFKPELKYSLHILTRSKRENNKNRRLPVSHTCFQQIEIEIYDTEDEFFDKLSKAINYTKNTFTLAGGKIKK